MKKITIAVVDDHRIIREGLISLFEGNEEIEIAGDYENGDFLLAAMEGQKYDLILLDMHMPQKGGIETASEILKRYPSTKVLIHTMSEILDEIEQIVKMGAHGYILKSAGQEELAIAIKLVAHGSSYYSSSVINSFIKSCIGTSRNLLHGLTKDEITTLKLFCEETPLRKMAAKMEVSETQITENIDHIKKLLDIKTDIGLAKFYAANYKQIISYVS